MADVRGGEASGPPLPHFLPSSASLAPTCKPPENPLLCSCPDQRTEAACFSFDRSPDPTPPPSAPSASGSRPSLEPCPGHPGHSPSPLAPLLRASEQPKSRVTAISPLSDRSTPVNAFRLSFQEIRTRRTCSFLLLKPWKNPSHVRRRAPTAAAAGASLVDCAKKHWRPFCSPNARHHGGAPGPAPLAPPRPRERAPQRPRGGRDRGRAAHGVGRRVKCELRSL